MRIIMKNYKMYLACILVTFPLCFGSLEMNFYKYTCPEAEATIQKIVQQRYAADKTVAPALLRMHYHDCFTRGCDASILIDSTPNNKAEKAASVNSGIREFELIDKIKSKLEEICPNTVSCADIIALATSNAVVLAGGLPYKVATGRRDGVISSAREVIMPVATTTISDAQRAFETRGLTLRDMVLLIGGHTIGSAHCNFFRDRITNFQRTGAPDPTMDAGLVGTLLKICGSNPEFKRTAFLDQNTSFVVDNEYYKQIVIRKGLLKIDQNLADDQTSSKLVSEFARSGNGLVGQEFSKVMIKLGNLDVLTGDEGQIRGNCRVFNQ